MFVGMAYWNDTAVGYVANGILELDGGVVNVEAGCQHAVHTAQDGFALRGRNVFNIDVAGERVAVRADAPDVYVMNIVHAINGIDGIHDVLH